jgi:hypothetical protein
MIKRSAYGALVLFGLALIASAAGTPHDDDVLVYGRGDPDKKMPPWSILAPKPGGWKVDCCNHAQALGVNLVMYQGKWTGKPEYVMVLLVWPSESRSLDSQLQADRQKYLQRHPAGKIEAFPVINSYGMACQGVLYESYQNDSNFDDAVVFCQPKNQASGLQLSWSITVNKNDSIHQQVLALFKRVVAGSTYMAYVPTSSQ